MTNIIDDIIKAFRGFAGGALLSGLGFIGLTTISPQIEDKNIKLASQLASLGAIGYGFYQMYESISPAPAEWIQEGEKLNVEILTPKPNDKWKKAQAINYCIIANVTNPYPKRLKFKAWFYMAKIVNPKGFVIRESQIHTIEPYETIQISKCVLGTDIVNWEDGDYAVSIVIRSWKSEEEEPAPAHGSATVSPIYVGWL